jgi:hypothetical protein
MRLLTSSPLDIERAIREPADAPRQLKSYATADLPPASEWTFGLVYDSDSATIKFSDGSTWKAFQPLDGDLTAIAALATTSFGRSHLGLADATAGRSLWGLGTAAVKNIGTSGSAVPLLDAANGWSGRQTLGAGVTLATGQSIVFDEATDVGLAVIGGNLMLFYGIFPLFEFVGGAGQINCSGYKVAGNQVTGARKTGWTAATGTPTRTSFATGSVTLPQLAERVKALIDDLISHGLIGA